MPKRTCTVCCASAGRLPARPAPFAMLGMPSRARFAEPIPKAAIGFRPEFLDFQRGIRVGNLEDHERITRLLKLEVEARYRQGFVTERWGRGVFWQWIAFLPRANREAKPVSSAVSFGCSKFFISVDTDEKLFKSGLQIERGYIRSPRAYPQCRLQPDWDWHRLVRGLKPGSAVERELKRLVVREGFRIFAGSWEEAPSQFSKSNFQTLKIRRALAAALPNRWAGFQLYYPMTEEEVRGSTGVDLVEAMLAVFEEVTPLMNLCQQIAIERGVGKR